MTKAKAGATLEKKPSLSPEEQDRKEAESLKKKLGTKAVYKLTVDGNEEDEKDEYIAWIKKPSLKEFSAFSTLAAKNDVIGGAKVIINSCFIKGDDEFLHDDDIFLGAVTQIEAIMSIRTASIKKF